MIIITCCLVSRILVIIPNAVGVDIGCEMGFIKTNIPADLLKTKTDGMLGIMLHSGSRHFGYIIAKYFNDLARKVNKKMNSHIPSEYQLAFLPTDTEEGQSYINYM